MRKLFLIAIATQLGATDCGEVLRDPGFDLWCGDQLCTWKVVRGDVMRIDTWHDGDSGVELVGGDAAIAQLSPVTSGDGTCIEFDLVANVAANANASLDIDIHGDGSIEHSLPIGAASWKPLTYMLHFDKPFTGIRFELAKRGPGKAAFANIGARTTTGCEGLPLIPPGLAPLGAQCSSDTHCESGICSLQNDPDSLFGASLRCTACEPGSCGSGEVCGLSSPTSPVLLVPLRCEPAGVAKLGEQCETGAECASGICTQRSCSTCAGSCPGGEVCQAAWAFGPAVCSPGEGRRTSGEPCATDGDCASGRCTGDPRKACSSDGRTCGNDINCPVLDNSLTPGTCSTVGVTGGTCQ